MSDDPVANIVALLRSDQNIDQKTRLKLADALEGNSNGVRFKVTNAKKTEYIRQLVREVARLRQGRYAKFLSAEIGWAPAIATLAQAMGKGEKTAELCVTLANQVDEWLASVQNSPEFDGELDRFELEIAYLWAKLEKREPRAVADEELQWVVSLVRQFEKMQDRALRHDQWFLT